MRKSFVFILTMLVTALLFPVGSANAKVALWENLGDWTVYGDSGRGVCSASASYNTGRTLTIVFAKGITSLAISGLSVNQGQTYKTVITASTGAAGVLDAYAISTETVVFMDINQVSIKALASAKSLFIQGLGTFELKGSRKAMASAWRCYEALNSF